MKKNIANIVNHSEVSEKVIERYLVEEVKKMKGICLKYSNSNMTGYPDRLVLLPGAVTFLVELKSKGKHVTQVQKIRIQELKALGYDAYVCDSRKSVDEILGFYKE